jgi:hypothetical protein
MLATRLTSIRTWSRLHQCMLASRSKKPSLYGHLREHGLLRSYFDTVVGSRRVAWLLHPSI